MLKAVVVLTLALGSSPSIVRQAGGISLEPTSHSVHVRIAQSDASSDRKQCIENIGICQRECSNLYGTGTDMWVACRTQCGRVADCPP